MSKPDPADGSLESILASIRKSLAEQSTDALSEVPADRADPAKDTQAGRGRGLAQRLAGAIAAAGQSAQSADDLSDLLDEAPAGPGPAPAAAASPAPKSTPREPAPQAKDPLWFLSRREEPPVAAAGLADGGAGPSVAEPRLTRPEEMRASMPPFFGSNAEAGPSPVQGEARAPGTGAVQQAAPRAAGTAAIAPASDAMVHEVSMVAAAAEAAAARPSPAGHSPSLNGGAPGLFEASAPAAGEAAHNRALEVMVLDLLKPMLRQWLDENMPRLVAEALAEEVQRSRAAKGDAKTS